MNEAEKALVKKVGDDFIAGLPALLAGEVTRLPASWQPIAQLVVSAGLPSVLPSVQAWFDALVA